MARTATMELRLEGAKELERAFNALPAAFQRKALRPALRAGTKVMREAVRHEAQASLATSGSPAPHVADTLKIKAMKRKRGRVGFVVITAPRVVLGIKSADTYYPAHIEYGHLTGPRVQTVTLEPLPGENRRATNRRTQLEAGRQHVPANPFMKRGLEAGRAAATAAIVTELASRMNDITGLDKPGAQVPTSEVDLGDLSPAEVF